MTYRNKVTGNLITPHNAQTEAIMAKSERYEAYTAPKAKPKKVETVTKKATETDT